MKKEELEELYMDIYDNGFINNDYKEKFKRYINNRLEELKEVVLTFETQEQADAAVLALSKGYEVEQWFTNVTSGYPYCVKFYIP